MIRSTSIRIGVAAGVLFVIMEVARLLILPPPPLDGTPTDVAGWMSGNLRVLRIFPWFDAVSASAFMVFGIFAAWRLRDAENGALVAVGGAAATLVTAVSLVLDATIAAMTGSGIGSRPEVGSVLLAAGVGVESMFPYPLAIFLGAAGSLYYGQGSRALGLTAWLIGLGFLASGALPWLDLDLEIEGPVFMALLVWIVAASVEMTLGRRETRPFVAETAT